jgi:hypothetical protein
MKFNDFKKVFVKKVEDCKSKEEVEKLLGDTECFLKVIE